MNLTILLNKIKAPISIWQNKSILTYLPTKINVDPCNICNLGCALCPSGTNSLKAPKGFMSTKTLKRILDDFKGNIDLISLYNWGEPLLNPDLPELIDMCNTLGVEVRISTNLMDLTPETARFLAKSKLRKIFVSCDGASSETYKIYHTKGDFNKVIDNIRLLLDEKKKANAIWKVVWLFHVFSHNEHELEKAKELGREIGIDVQFNPIRTDMGREIFETREQAVQNYGKWIPKNPQFNKYQNPKTVINTFCKRPWHETTIAWNGDVLPCCGVYETDKYTFGNILSQDFKSIWNGEKYISSRREILGQTDNSNTICHICRKTGYLHF